MDTSKKSFIRENIENGNGLAGLVDGLSFYTNRFLDVINEGNPMDIPIIVAALHHTEHVMRESKPFKRLPSAPLLTDLMLAMFRADFEEIHTVVPKALLDKLRETEEGET